MFTRIVLTQSFTMFLNWISSVVAVFSTMRFTLTLRTSSLPVGFSAIGPTYVDFLTAFLTGD